MKILIREDKIVGTATDEYTGPEEFIESVEDIDIEQYQVTAGQITVKIPKQVTMRQARLALLQQGILNDVETAINTIEDDALKQAIKIEWEYALDIQRDWPALQLMTKQLGITEEQLDQLFLLASKI